MKTAHMKTVWAITVYTKTGWLYENKLYENKFYENRLYGIDAEPHSQLEIVSRETRTLHSVARPGMI